MSANQNISLSPSVNNSLREHYSAPRAALTVFFVAVAWVIGLCVWAATAHAEVACDERDIVMAVLAEKYKEAPVAAGITNSGGLVEVFKTEGFGTWTITVTSPEGLMCLIAAGEGWQERKRPSGDPRA